MKIIYFNQKTASFVEIIEQNKTISMQKMIELTASKLLQYGISEQYPSEIYNALKDEDLALFDYASMDLKYAKKLYDCIFCPIEKGKYFIDEYFELIELIAKNSEQVMFSIGERIGITPKNYFSENYQRVDISIARAILQQNSNQIQEDDLYA